ncbi:MAG: phospholipid carrier-dependent glycosyltransferase [Candidatus Altiarchaeales archaeon]|nr:phospholipid carrier-dependent glycosyltransferase [Candidatus Altiarchaeales archaeon]MBD3416252.1 phospholipid carrier-dependent glycosyltransferase [Candidatus Altiarchaeales archaeon]
MKKGFNTVRWLSAAMAVLFILEVLFFHQLVYSEAEQLGEGDREFLDEMSIMYGFPVDGIYHVDEPYWMHGTYAYQLLFKEKSLLHRDWQHPHMLDQPQLSRLILGLGLDLRGGDVGESIAGLMNWKSIAYHNFWVKNGIENKERDYEIVLDRELEEYMGYLMGLSGGGKMTSFTRRDYRIARETAYFFAVLSALTIMAISYRVYPHPLTSIIAGQVFLANGVAVPAFERVLSESICTFFTLTTLALVMKLGESRSKRKWAFLAGVSLGMALSTKFTTAYMIPVAAVALLLDRKTEKRELVGAATILALSATISFLLLNPSLYPDPVGNTAWMVSHRAKMMGIQSGVQPEAIRTLDERVRLIIGKGVLMDSSESMTIQGMHIILFIWGLRHIYAKARVEFASGRMGRHAVASLFIASTFIVVGASIHMDWQRYYIPFMLCSVIAFSAGLGQAIKDVFEDGKRG